MVVGSFTASKGSVNVGKRRLEYRVNLNKKDRQCKNINTPLWKMRINTTILHDRFCIQTKYILS